jgi:hypothetical protein
LKSGGRDGKPAFFANVIIDDKIEIVGCPVWNGRPGEYNVGLPTRVTDKGNRIPIVKLSPGTYSDICAAIFEEIRRKRASG